MRDLIDDLTAEHDGTQEFGGYLAESHHWTAGDVVFWDNRITAHYATAHIGNVHRVMQRATSIGDVSVGIA